MSDEQVPVGVQADPIGLIVNLPVALLRQVDEHRALAQFSRFRHRKRQDPVPLALGHQQSLAVRADHDSIGKRQTLVHRVANALAVEVMD